MADRALLAVQLLLLACQAKVHFIEVAGKQLRRSLVPNLTPHGLPLPPPQQQQQSEQQQQQQQQQQQEQQEQQVQQPIAAAKPEYLRLQDHHDLLLESYSCKNTDIVAILGQQQEELQSSM
jgi:Tfp pilus assembly protein PilP